MKRIMPEIQLPSTIGDIHEKAKRAKKWGEAHGFFGSVGGWIYNGNLSVPMDGPRGGRLSRFGVKVVCQGWHRLYESHWQLINPWFKKIRRAKLFEKLVKNAGGEILFYEPNKYVEVRNKRGVLLSFTRTEIASVEDRALCWLGVTPEQALETLETLER